MSLIILSFFSNYLQGGKEVSDSLDQVSLNLEISLPYLMGTSVTGSLPPLSYFFKLGFSAHSFTNYAALNMRQLTTETYCLKFIVEFYIESISIMIFENSLKVPKDKICLFIRKIWYWRHEEVDIDSIFVLIDDSTRFSQSSLSLLS